MKYLYSAVALLAFAVTLSSFFSRPASAQAGSSSQASSQNTTSEPANLAPAKFFYSTEYQNDKVGGYLVNPTTGELSSNGQPPVWAHWGPTRIASDAGGHHLYVANQGSQDVSAYMIRRTDGWLFPVPGANFTVGGVSTDIAVHPSSKFVYVTTSDDNDGAKGNSDSVSGFSVAANGSLVAVPGSPYITSGPSLAIAIDPNGQYLYASSLASDSNVNGQINAYSINQTTGVLTPIAGSPFPIVAYSCQDCFSWDDIFGMAIDPSGNFLIGGGQMNGVIYIYRIEAGTGVISEVAGSPFIEGLPAPGFPSAEPTDVSITPTSKYVLVSNNGINGLAMYDFDSSTGALSNMTMSPSPYNTWSTDSGVVRTDPSGKLVYTLGWISNGTPGMIGFDIGSSGSMTIVPDAPYPDAGVQSFSNNDGIAVTR